MQQIRNQSDAERPFDQNLQGPLPIAQGDSSLDTFRITTLHLLGHLINDGGLAFEQTGPHPLVLRARGSLPVGESLTLDTEQAFDDLFWGAYPGRAGEHGGHGELAPRKIGTGMIRAARAKGILVMICPLAPIPRANSTLRP